MPETKEYNGKKANSSKRRPHKEEPLVEESVEAVESSPAHVNIDQTQAEAKMISEGGPAFGEEPSEQVVEKTKLEFYGSEMIRMKAPKAMEIADTIADQWVKDGEFDGLPLGNPLAQMAAAKALRTAKDVEKKLEEKGVIAMARMGLDLVKSKINKR